MSSSVLRAFLLEPLGTGLLPIAAEVSLVNVEVLLGTFPATLVDIVVEVTPLPLEVFKLSERFEELSLAEPKKRSWDWPNLEFCKVEESERLLLELYRRGSIPENEIVRSFSLLGDDCIVCKEILDLDDCVLDPVVICAEGCILVPLLDISWRERMGEESNCWILEFSSISVVVSCSS